MWTYYFDNMGRDCPVAIFRNSRNIVVLKVIETRDSHVSIPTVDFIKSFSISYYDESQLSGELPTDSTDDVLKKRLIVGCNQIEENYKKQVNYLKSIIS